MRFGPASLSITTNLLGKYYNILDIYINILLRVKLLFISSDTIGFCVYLSDHVTSLTREVLRGALRNPNLGIHYNKSLIFSHDL